jgi:hypothetical protein
MKPGRPSVGLVTCKQLPEPDPDQDLLLGALGKAGMHAELLAWDDPGAEPAEHDLCVLRSCWNYYERPADFSKWIDSTAAVTRLRNGAEVVRWNLHKGYLGFLAESGVPIIPTVWFERGGRVDLRAILDREGWRDIVVKPAISASSYRTRRFGVSEVGEAQVFLDGLLADRDAMIQVYLPAVESSGERAIVWIDGKVTHAVAKSPRFADGVERVSDALEVSDEERMFTQWALDQISEPLLYARADVVIQDGSLLLSELELMEPSLFLMQSPSALDRFVAAIHRDATAAD